MRVFVIGLDCVPPSLVFDKFSESMPNLRKLWKRGVYGPMKSTMPPITVPAWAAMASGRDPGEIGLYGFCHRRNFSYDKTWIARSGDIRVPMLWDFLAEHDKRTVLIGFPPSCPLPSINGIVISDFITPEGSDNWAYPPRVMDDVNRLVDGYMFDVSFRNDDKEKILKDIYRMTEKRFKVVEYLMEREEWDLFWFVEIGVDRIHHAFWKFMDESHHLYTPDNPYKGVIEEYYRFLDEKIGALLEKLDDDIAVLVVSDHGAKGMKGAFCINEWLIENGYLSLENYPSKEGTLLNDVSVDWENTRAWAWGGYYSRVFLNVKGRERSGTISPDDYEDVRNQLAEELSAVVGPGGERLNNIVMKPEEIYSSLSGDVPDLMVVFDDLYWRPVGTVGWNSLYLDRNDIGPDDAVHDWYGIFILYLQGGSQGLAAETRMREIHIKDVAPTLLSLLDIDVPDEMKGKVIM